MKQFDKIGLQIERALLDEREEELSMTREVSRRMSGPPEEKGAVRPDVTKAEKSEER